MRRTSKHWSQDPQPILPRPHGSSDLDSCLHPAVQHSPAAHDDSCVDTELARCLGVSVPLRRYRLNLSDYLPRWQILVEQQDGLPSMTLRWRAPSRVWQGHPVLGFMADTDFQAPTGKLPEVVGFRAFHPMWSFLAVKGNKDSITFGMDSTRFCDNPTHTKDALCAQCPIVVFKASTVLKNLGIIASNPSTIFRCSRRISRAHLLPNNRGLCLHL